MKKIFSLKDFKLKSEILHKSKKSIGLCHGVFDLLHLGHIRHFQEAKKKSESLAIQFNWELITVPGVGHDNYNLAPRACMYLFGN